MTRRPNLTVVYRAEADDYAYDPPFWLGIVVILGLGVVLAPVAYWLVLGAHALGGGAAMSLRQMLRWWLAWLRCERGPGQPLPVVLALPAPIAPEEPPVTPDRSGYRRPEAGCVVEAARWLLETEERGWWGSEPNDMLHAALILLAIREQVTGVRLK